MHLDILSSQQDSLLPFISTFKREFYLAGGTAVALHIGHRESLDFDLFKLKPLKRDRIYQRISDYGFTYRTTFLDYNQIDLIVEGVKLTFFQFPYDIKATDWILDIIKTPDLLTLAAMKAFALGRRAKWKDYVDLYFLLRDHFSVSEISQKAKELFPNQFVKKQFIAQLGYFTNIDYSEEVHYCISTPPDKTEVKDFLSNISLSEL